MKKVLIPLFFFALLLIAFRNNNNSKTHVTIVVSNKKSLQMIREPAQQPPPLAGSRLPMTKLDTLDKCKRTQKCDFNNLDSRSYNINVNRSIAHELNTIYESILVKPRVNLKFSKLAIKYLKYNDGHIKEQALNVLSTQPPRVENIKSIFENVLLYHDDSLISQALMEAQRYKNIVSTHLVMNYFNKVLKTSSPALREQLTKNISPFINTETYSIFIEFLKTLPINSISYKNLNSALNYFKFSNIE